jgi:hypothetical protein
VLLPLLNVDFNFTTLIVLLYMNKTILSAILLHVLFFTARSAGGDTAIATKKYFTKSIANAQITIDGIPSEEAWKNVEYGEGFTQFQPNEGKSPSQQTQFKILYDEKYLYVAYWCHDLAVDSIVKRMGRRDDFPGDFIEINIDSYHDKRTAFSFTLSVSGVRGDEFVSNDGNNWDESWNPIWYGKTNINKMGWTAEVKIPFSQLRYGNEPEKVWGFQIMRRIFRKEERSIWQYIPQSSGVWVSRFGELHGIKNIPVYRQVEIAPYVIARAEKYKKEASNPFATGFDKKLTIGIDGKLAVTNDLILDFTVNPDFGQVEADPSQVRIDGFQNFFEERRPFFIESRNIFDYQLTGSEAGGEYDSDLLFYSRRIGSPPHGYANTLPGEYAKMPQNTSILGAAKFSGKTKKGLSMGVLESITQREMATIDYNGNRKKQLVEPLASYFVSRVQQDYNGGNSIIGGIFTAVNREEGLSEMLHRNAFSGGVDFLHFWKNRSWYLKANIVISNVLGSKEAILNTQTSFEHLFQRPGATEFSLDAGRTSLTGTGGTFKIGKSGGKSGRLGQVFKFETGLTVRSPQLELNDIGFMLTSNEINHFTFLGVHFQKPFSVFRNARINYNHWSRWDYSGKLIFLLINSNAHVTFKNNWESGTGITWNPLEISNNALRGAAAMRRPNGMGIFYYISTDNRKKVRSSININSFWGFGNTTKGYNLSYEIRYQPINSFNIIVSAAYNRYRRRQDQFVKNINFNNVVRTIVGQVKQNTLRFTTRLNYNITPDLTIQYYGQPFITRPIYDNFALVSNPMAKQYENRFSPFASNQISYSNGQYLVDENKDGIVDYRFDKPDFNFVEFRSNLVARWEYKPGSEIFLVWSQSNTADAFNDLNSPIASSLFDNAFATQARNIFLLKWTYRFLK